MLPWVCILTDHRKRQNVVEHEWQHRLSVMFISFAILQLSQRFPLNIVGILESKHSVATGTFKCFVANKVS